MQTPILDHLKKKIEFQYSKEDTRAKFQKRTLCDVLAVLSLLISIVNNFTGDHLYSFVMLVFFIFALGCSLAFRFQKNTLAPTAAFYIACMLVTLFVMTMGVGNLSSLLWLAVIPNVIFLFLQFRHALIILFSILAVMVVLYLTPLADALHLEFNVLFSRWNVLLVYCVFFFICGNLEFLRHLTNLKLEESRKEILRLSLYDDLTQIFNRRSFDNALLELWTSPLSGKNKTSLLMIDIDNFKMYNDNFGHLQGDKVLTQIALTISEVITNETYTLARYGGEEFVVLMPGTDCLGATSLAECMKTAVSALGLTYYDTSEAASKILSISIGVATEELNRLESAETLIRIADENLYRAKRNGKNVVWSSLNHQTSS